MHLVAAAVLVVGAFRVRELSMPGWGWAWPPAVGVVVGVLLVAWMINLYNFMDGMDGFAAGMAVAGFGTFAILGWRAGEDIFATLNLVVVAAAAGFLLLNLPPARIFMGDAGSSLLGFLAGAFMLWADHDGIFPLRISVVVFSPFIVDATFTLFRRLAKGDKVWEAHRSHLYQRLVQAGWGHRRTLYWEYVLMIACGVLGLLAAEALPTLEWFIFSIAVGLYVVYGFVVRRAEANLPAAS